MKKYFLRTKWYDKPKEVTKNQFIAAERNAGFHPKSGKGCATGGFSGGGVHGMIKIT